MGMERKSEIPGMVPCDNSEEDRRQMVGRFAEDKVNPAKSKVMVLNGEEGLELVGRWDSFTASRNLNTWGVLDKSGSVIGSWRVGLGF